MTGTTIMKLAKMTKEELENEIMKQKKKIKNANEMIALMRKLQSAESAKPKYANLERSDPDGSISEVRGSAGLHHEYSSTRESAHSS